MIQSLLTLSLLIPMTIAPALSADESRTLIFEDDFERSESQEMTDAPGNGWGTNSKSRAAGNKQVDLKDGAMFIKIHPAADHAVSVTHPAEFQHGVVELKFMLENEKDTLGLDFADLSYKAVHAGHLFKVDVGTKVVQINDMKSGNMNLKFYDAKKASTLTAEQKAFLATTTKRFPVNVSTGQWHTLSVSIVRDRVTVEIDGTEAGRMTAVGVAHPTKRKLRLSVPRNAVVDDVKIYSLSEAADK